MKRSTIYAAIIVAFASHAYAVGDHYAVEAATLQGPGQCDSEFWAERRHNASGSLLHAGGGCRVGLFEYDTAVERERADDETVTAAALQLKWAQPFSEQWRIGALAGIGIQDTSTPFSTGFASALLSWQAFETFALHANFGRSLHRNEDDRSLIGFAFEWTALESLNLIGERFKEGGDDYFRLGLHWVVDPQLSVDLSRAHGLQSGDDRPWWTLGLNWQFE